MAPDGGRVDAASGLATAHRAARASSLVTRKTRGNSSRSACPGALAMKTDGETNRLRGNSLCNRSRELIRPNREIIRRRAWETGFIANSFANAWGRPLVEISGRPHCHDSARLPNNSARRFAPGGNRAKLEPVRLSVRQAMSGSPHDALTTPRADELGLLRIANRTGFSISLLPNGAIFAMEHAAGGAPIMVNQVLGSPIAGRHGPPLPACRRRRADDAAAGRARGARARPALAATGRSGRERRTDCAMRSASGCIPVPTFGSGAS